MADSERFWSKVSGACIDDCWNWTASKERHGYGHFRYNGGQLAHRFSYELEYGPIPDGMQVLHRCDNPSCVNPKHLFLGSLQDNMNDRNSKWRQVHGADHRSAILNDEKVMTIRREAANGVKLSVLAKRFGVAGCTAQQACTGITWRHLPLEVRHGR